MIESRAAEVLTSHTFMVREFPRTSGCRCGSGEQNHSRHVAAALAAAGLLANETDFQDLAARWESIGVCLPNSDPTTELQAASELRDLLDRRAGGSAVDDARADGGHG